MAMRPRGGAVAATPNGRRSGGVWPVFEDFKPTSEWQQDDESHVLMIYLPGFMKEQIRVSTEGRNIIRARGERVAAGNKWSRFQEDFQVPENCEMNSIRAKFQGGILYISVPKRKVDKPQEALPPKPTSTDTPKQQTPQKGQDQVPQAVVASQPTDQKGLETQKTSDDPSTKQGRVDVQRDRTSITPFRDAGRVVAQDAERKESSLLKEKHSASERADNETARKIKLKKDDGAAATSEAKEKDKESKRKQVTHSSGADYGDFTMGRYKKAVKGLAELNEERQLLMNMGVAVLVIVALSAYVTYKFASGKDKS
ncbi:hypothetical protein Pfo_001904 [Paulownia fortunei]|nr:hypothetical protein Pfo_001904 [Paulownia fortunei]